MTEASTHLDSPTTRRVMEVFLSSASDKWARSTQATPPFSQWYGKSAGVIVFDSGFGGTGGENLSLVAEIVQSSEGTHSCLNVITSAGCLYVNTIVSGFLNQSDVDTTLLGVLHAEEFDPQEFHDVGEQQSLLTRPSAIVEALEFLPQNLIFFSESLVELLRSEAMSLGVPILSHEWSVFADPEDLGKELVLGMTVNATSERALEFWDKISETVSAKKQLLSPTDQKALSKHLSVQIYWP